MSNSASKIKCLSLDELLVTGLPLNVLHTFHSHPQGHPFRVLDDARMAETVDSVRQQGVLIPSIARPDKDFPGEYEVIAGHRRRRASELAGLADMPFIVKYDLNDYQACEIMVDTNIQREDLLESERAWAYRVKYDAIKGMGRGDGLRNDAVLAEQAGISRQTIQRYIRLTFLIPELLQLVDDGKVPKNTAAELSYLTEEEQRKLLAAMEKLKVVPSGAQAGQLKQLSKSKGLKYSDILNILVREADRAPARVSLPARRIRSYFPESYTGEQIEEVIYRLLDEWKKQEMNKV